MPNSKAAAKRMRSDAKKSMLNKAVLSEIKNLNKKLASISSDPAKAEELSKQVISRYDKAVSKNVIPRGRADRKKSRITSYIKSLKK